MHPHKKAGALPVAVPEKIIALALMLDFFDRGRSLGSLIPPTGGGRLAPQLRYTRIFDLL